MRTVNSKRKFIARVFDKEIYIDTGDGTGFHEVLEVMKGVMQHFSRKTAEPEDFYQDLCVIMLEAILAYNPSRNTSLSTFLYKVAYHKLLDSYKHKEPMLVENCAELAISVINYTDKIEIKQCAQNWDDRWKSIMFRLFVEGQQIKDVAQDENITPWGLTRAVRRKLLEARNFSRKRK